MIRNHPYIAFIAPVLVFAISFVMVSGSLLSTHPSIARGVTIDLTILSPFLYWILIRKTSIPKITVVPVFASGIAVAGFLLPESQQGDLNFIIQYLLPVVELIVILVVVFHVWKAAKFFRGIGRNVDVYDSIREVSQRIVDSSKVGNLLAMELASSYYALFTWRKHDSSGFSYHRNSGAVALFIALIGLVLVETAVLHLLLNKWSSTVAWILTILSIYTAIQLMGHVKAMSRRPITIENGTLTLKYGLFGDAAIDLSLVEAAIRTERDWLKEEGTHKLSMLGSLEPHNMELTLKEDVTFTKAYGFTTQAKSVLFYADDPEALILAIES